MSGSIQEIRIRGGRTKTGEAEPVQDLLLERGDVVALAGPTGSGKSMLLSDIEQMAAADTPSGRVVQVVGLDGGKMAARPIAQLSQTMNFVIDMNVGAFLEMHTLSRGISDGAIVKKVISLANGLAGEPLDRGTNITTLSGGQSRALMIADVAIISDSPVVLIDEIENAGIDRLGALDLLSSQGKIILIASHDPLIILKADRRIVMRGGGMQQVRTTHPGERALLHRLSAWDRKLSGLRESLRNGLAVGVEEETGPLW